MNRVSYKTLILLLLLLASVVIHQYGPFMPSAEAGAVWLADVPLDPNPS